MKRNVLVLTMVLGASIPFADLSAAEYFVDAAHGSDSYDGTAATWAGGESTVGPKKTIQAVVNLIADGNGTTITLLPGVYDEGGDVNTAKNNGTDNVQSNRVVIKKNKVTIRSSTGKAKDVHIVGRKSTAAGNDHGIGAGAMRCLAVNYAVSGAVVVGVTFRDGASESATRGGGVFGYSLANLTIIDCVVSNCAGYRGGGAAYITAHSSLFTGNYASSSYGSALGYSKLANCLVVYNSTDASNTFGYMYTMVNCTVARNGNSGANLVNGAGDSPGIYNTLVFGHRGSNGAGSIPFRSCVVCENKSLTDADELTVIGAQAADECASPDLGDWRPLSTGDCPNRGVGAYLGLVPLPEGYTYHDMAGNVIDTNSTTITVGAFQETVTPVAARIVFGTTYEIEGEAYPRWSSGGWINPTVWPVVYRFRSVVPNVYAMYAAEENLSGNVHALHHATYDGWTAFSPAPDPDGRLNLAIESSGGTLYADAVNGNDSYDGTAAEWAGGESTVGPKKTLQAAVDAAIANGYSYPIIQAAPGIYQEGGAVCEGYSNRVCDAQHHVGIIASGGPGSATIVGAPDPETQGLGPNAMRCVMMTSMYSFIQGFVLTGGHTANVDSDNAYVSGAGFSSPSYYPQVLDCVVSNNFGGRGGGGYRCTVMRSKVLRNRATIRAAASRGTSYYRSIIDGNVGDNHQLEMFGLDSCTVGPNAKDTNGNNCKSALYNCSTPIVNSLILVPKLSNSSTHIRGTNNVFITGCGVLDEDIVDCIVTNLSAVAIDDDYRPIIGSNVGIDRAVETLGKPAFFGGLDADLSGAQGVMNGARDLGALEADWRPRYAEDLGGRCTVTTVSPEVRENAEGHIYLPSGSLEGTFVATSRATRRNLGVLVTGTGKLTVTVAGEVVGEFTANGGDVQNSLLALSTTGDAFAFSYVPGKNDTGGAEIVECMRLVGTALSIR